MDLESVTNMVITALQENSDFEIIEQGQPGLIFAALVEDGRMSHFEINIEEF